MRARTREYAIMQPVLSLISEIPSGTRPMRLRGPAA
jgi:hypothetical protein